MSHVLRFVGNMLTDNPTDKDRAFIISFFLSDDTIAVFEPAQRNSGMPQSSLILLSLINYIFFSKFPKVRKKFQNVVV